MTENPEQNRGCSSTAILLIIVLGAPLLLFVPLLLAGIEYYTMGTNYVEDFCRDIGIHGFLGKIYEPVFRFFSRLF